MKWAIELPDGQFLDTAPDFELQFELNNIVFSSSETASLPGSFSFPVDVPVTKRMRAQLGHPTRVDTANRTSYIDGVWALAGGIRLFYGTLKLVESSQKTIKLTLISNPVAALKDTLLPALDLGGARTVAPTSWVDHMKETVDTPEDYDYIFLPVGNENAPDPSWNNWDLVDEVFVESGSIITPSIRLEYLLERIFALAGGWAFGNQFQAGSLELGRLYVFNNVDARVLTDSITPTLALPDDFLLNKHVPNITCAEFLKKLMSQWCLGLFVNVFTKEVKLIALKDLLRRPATHDWTEYAVPDLTISEPTKVPGYYNYDNTASTIPAEAPAVEDAILLRTTTEFNAGPLTEAYYYIETNSVMHKHGSGVYDNVNYRLVHRGVRVGDGEDYQAGMAAIWDQIEAYQWKGGYTGYIVEDGEYKFQKEDYPVALLFYRGLQNVISGGGLSPLCGNSVWLDGVGTPGDHAKLVTGGVEVGESEQSLNWFGDYGLYEKYHRTWSTMLRDGKHCSQTFILPISTLISFSFAEKVRVGDMDFFLKRIRVAKLLNQGLVQIEVSMISVL